jgi:hypothetical protein
MSISSLSFWQQNQNYWARAAKASQAQAQSNAVINNMFSASTTLSAGLASIANQTALSRVNSQLSAAVQSALNGINGGSSDTSSSQASSSSSSSSSSSTSATSSASTSAAAPATGTGKVPLTSGTSLLTLGILASGTITVGDGTNTTSYQSTGSDTVGDLLNAINTNAYGNAQVTAWLDTSGKLVITAKDPNASVLVAGANALNIGFGAGNDFFQPTAPKSTSTGSSSSSSSSPSSTSSKNSSTSTSTTSKTTTSNPLRNSALALQSAGTAEILLASSGLSGTSIVNLLV